MLGRSLIGILSLMLFSNIGFATAKPCLLEPAAYTAAHYSIRSVRIDSPLAFFQAASSLLNQFKPALPAQEGQSFSATQWSAGVEVLNSSVRTALPAFTRFRIVATTAAIEDCDDPGSANPKLAVVYHVFLFYFPTFAAPQIEVRRAEIQKPAPAAAESNTTGKYFVMPVAAYNASLHMFGGVNGSVAAPIAVFDRLSGTVSGSSTSAQDSVSLAGARDLSTKILGHIDYSANALYLNTPSPLTPLKQSLVDLRFFSLSKPIGFAENSNASATDTSATPPGSLSIRFGAVLSGGTQQTNLPNVPVQSTVGSSSGGTLKLALGATTRWAWQSAAASYGLQLGSTSPTVQVDYVKEVLDAAWNASFEWPSLEKQNNRHYPVIVQTRLNAGFIQTPGSVPVTERFFGGNSVADFVPTADWQILSGPLISSIPQNRLAGSGIGGTKFYSFNLALAPTVWATPLVPWSVLRDPDFSRAKDTAINTAIRFQKIYYEGQEPAAQAAKDDLSAMLPILNSLATLLSGLEGKLPESLNDDLQAAAHETERAKQKVTNAIADPSEFLAVPAGVNPAIKKTSALAKLIPETPDLSQAQKDLNIQVGDLGQKLATFRDHLKNIDEKEAETKAKADLAIVRPVLDTFLNELNLIALSPVAVFDVARLWPDPMGTRYGLGGGLRATFLNLNLTVGYSFNPQPEPQLRQGRGATFVKFEVADLFR